MYIVGVIYLCKKQQQSKTAERSNVHYKISVNILILHAFM